MTSRITLFLNSSNKYLICHKRAFIKSPIKFFIINTATHLQLKIILHTYVAYKILTQSSTCFIPLSLLYCCFSLLLPLTSKLLPFGTYHSINTLLVFLALLFIQNRQFPTSLLLAWVPTLSFSTTNIISPKVFAALPHLKLFFNRRPSFSSCTNLVVFLVSYKICILTIF